MDSLAVVKEKFIKNDIIVKPLDKDPVHPISMHSKDLVCIVGSSMSRAFDAGVEAERKRIIADLKGYIEFCK